mmetsp:Transcript_3746/g.5679  ORF Transcript_3746/g.5679 Transcript_3746/m.5679 type:complete len:374 (+) Transcript_3746:120-1241(+)
MHRFSNLTQRKETIMSDMGSAIAWKLLPEHAEEFVDFWCNVVGRSEPEIVMALSRRRWGPLPPADEEILRQNLGPPGFVPKITPALEAPADVPSAPAPQAQWREMFQQDRKDAFAIQRIQTGGVQFPGGGNGGPYMPHDGSNGKPAFFRSDTGLAQGFNGLSINPNGNSIQLPPGFSPREPMKNSPRESQAPSSAAEEQNQSYARVISFQGRQFDVTQICSMTLASIKQEIVTINDFAKSDVVQNFFAEPHPPSKEILLKIGRIGEEIVHSYFESQGKKCVWPNRDSEKGLPYDISLPDENATTTYIEVKTTTNTSKQFVELSWKQLMFAKEKGESYHIYRVVLLGPGDAKLMKYVNPYALLENKLLQICIVI